VQRVTAAIQAHLAGRPAQYDPADLDLSGCTAFARQVYARLMAVPPGQTQTYGQLAQALGKPGAARAVGRAMATNPVPLAVPCHRVVAQHGLGGFTGGLDFKRRLLALEGARLLGE
jgi:methylated-DNA-[protein]-cysteine S-methyltransferase